MSRGEALLAELSRNGIAVRLQAGRLQTRGTFPPALRAAFDAFKGEIRQALASQASHTCPDCGSAEGRFRYGQWACYVCCPDLTEEAVAILHREIVSWEPETALDVLANLRLAGIKLWLKDGERIGYEAPPEAIGKGDLLALLRQHGRELFRLLREEGGAEWH